MRHIGIVTQDATAAASFWLTVFGYRIKSDLVETGAEIDELLGLNNVQVRTVKLEADNLTSIELLEFARPRPRYRKTQSCPYLQGITHIALNVQNLSTTLKQLKDAGGQLLGTPSTSVNGLTRGVYCLGPEGVLLELVEDLNK